MQNYQKATMRISKTDFYLMKIDFFLKTFCNRSDSAFFMQKARHFSEKALYKIRGQADD